MPIIAINHILPICNFIDAPPAFVGFYSFSYGCHQFFLHREVDYQELYRVVDFNESQTFMQQLFRLKTVSIYSGDRTTPRLDIIGVPMKENLVTAIRERVETNKRRRSIYEITNR
jgi:hypothetical protein